MNIVDRAIELCTRAITQGPEFEDIHIVLTGGRTGSMITQRMGVVATEVPPSAWDRVHLWWGDERFVPRNSPERNDFGIETILGDRYSPDRVHRALGNDQCNDVEASAENYLEQLTQFGPQGPQFSLVIVGMGPDGHIASLFPQSPQLSQTELCVAVKDSPKPPSERITLTLTALNRTSVAVILAGGIEKVEALHRLCADQGSTEDTPARGISAPVVEILQ